MVLEEEEEEGEESVGLEERVTKKGMGFRRGVARMSEAQVRR